MLDKVEGIEDIHFTKDAEGVTCVEIKPEEHTDIRERVFRAFAESQVTLLEMTTVRASLEDVFLELTQQPESEAQENDAETTDQGKEDEEA